MSSLPLVTVSTVAFLLLYILVVFFSFGNKEKNHHHSRATPQLATSLGSQIFSRAQHRGSLSLPKSLSLDDISTADLAALVHATYNAFTGVIPISHRSSHSQVTTDEPCLKYILELFHGPTYTFKDVVLQLLGNPFSKRDGKSFTLVSVSAAPHGSNLPNHFARASTSRACVADGGQRVVLQQGEDGMNVLQIINDSDNW
ncbi:hypothetical protein K503DRAFT_864122 [Rhizopogon vinicolor AM-OR11-026]|uniref:Uncharacterized protein n=1 Tax=Rhizopogon vinicolor AM-OR11-026 TaxID=1314800 RepID=A0A1B7N8F7_9AGAM|nr:hypothetical protein K503DRAFT_864122 [Rhizopogon vinicolor AM-OR11-026]